MKNIIRNIRNFLLFLILIIGSFPVFIRADDLNAEKIEYEKIYMDLKIHSNSIFDVNWNIELLEPYEEDNIIEFNISKHFTADDSKGKKEKYIKAKNFKSKYKFKIENDGFDYIIKIDVPSGTKNIDFSYQMHNAINENLRFYDDLYNLELKLPTIYNYRNIKSQFIYSITFPKEFNIDNLEVIAFNNQENFNKSQNKISGVMDTVPPKINLNNLNGKIKYTNIPIYDYALVFIYIIAFILIILALTNKIKCKRKIFSFGFICLILRYLRNFEYLSYFTFLYLFATIITVIICMLMFKFGLFLRRKIQKSDNNLLLDQKLIKYDIVIFALSAFTILEISEIYSYSIFTLIGLINYIILILSYIIGVLSIRYFFLGDKPFSLKDNSIYILFLILLLLQLI